MEVREFAQHIPKPFIHFSKQATKAIKIISDWNGAVLSFWVWESLTLAPELNLWDSATLLRRCFLNNQFSERRKKYRWLGAILRISLFQRSPPIADIFCCDSRFSGRENTAEVALPSLKNWARKPMSKITTLRMIGWGHSSLQQPVSTLKGYFTMRCRVLVFMLETVLMCELDPCDIRHYVVRISLCEFRVCHRPGLSMNKRLYKLIGFWYCTKLFKPWFLIELVHPKF